MGLKLLVEQSLDCKETEIKITCISMRAQFSRRLEATLKNNIVYKSVDYPQEYEYHL